MTALRIGEAAKRTGVSAVNIRYYEKEGLLAPAARHDNDYRFYGEADLHRLRFIRMCRAMDMSLDEVRTLLALDGRKPDDCHAAAATIEAHLHHVRQRLKELRALEKELQSLKAVCDGQQPRCNLIAALHAQADASLPPEPGSHVKRHV
ncbi:MULTISPECIES: MerR family transcriptional regulator [Comamonas]|jgi:DNA-binding transcriptional MerR regulator|uniref:MerR family transcriptional regulator n=1 Tax=Comamonas TaxID=283 RepID=UPI001C58EE5B|nr:MULTISPECIES: MerR family transcriptional regulator [Comamonas]QXW19417.1 MerR family transcriptional regulator [Comamonas aquatica]